MNLNFDNPKRGFYVEGRSNVPIFSEVVYVSGERTPAEDISGTRTDALEAQKFLYKTHFYVSRGEARDFYSVTKSDIELTLVTMERQESFKDHPDWPQKFREWVKEVSKQ